MASIKYKDPVTGEWKKLINRGNTSAYVGEEPPTDNTNLWVDTTSESLKYKDAVTGEWKKLTEAISNAEEADDCDYIFGKTDSGEKVSVSKEDVAKIMSEIIRDSAELQSNVAFGANTLQALQTTIGTNLYGATTAAGLASVVAGNIGHGDQYQIDLNTLKDAGNYNIIATSTYNGPLSSTLTNFSDIASFMSVQKNGACLTQMITLIYKGDTYIRAHDGTTWSPWKQLG